jgi:hypothetical protein
MTTFTPEQKQPVIKMLAIAGLVAVIIFITWVSIQIVQAFPAALNSVASLAHSVYNYDPTKSRDLVITPGETLVNIDQPFTVGWEATQASGSFAFSYACTEGTALTLATPEKEYGELTCGAQYDLGNINKISLTATETTERYTDIAYTLSFFRPNNPTAAASHTATTTVVNQTILTASNPEPLTATSTLTIATTTRPEVATSTSSVTEPSTPEAEAVPVVTTPVVTQPATPTPTIIYEIPTSDPDGITDLVVTYLGIGTLNTSGQFINSGVIAEDTIGAFQFAVHNIGTKTSDEWSFSATLPGGSRYQSGDEDPLKPNERAVLLIEFPKINNSTAETFSVVVDTDEDLSSTNNTFTITALVTQY